MRTRRVVIAAVTLLLSVGSACSGDSTEDTASGSDDGGSATSVTAPASDRTAAVSDSTAAPGVDDADSPCERLAGSLPFDGGWTPNYDDDAAAARGYDNGAPQGDVNYDRRLGCGLSNGGTAAVSVSANRIVDPAEWDTTYAYRTGEAGCHAVEGPVAGSKGYVCPPDDRSSFTTAVVGAGGWVYEVELANFDGATNEINRDVGPVTNPDSPTDAIATSATEAWITAVGDPTGYDLAGADEAPVLTTAPTPTTRG